MACSQEPSVGSSYSNRPPTYCFLRESLPGVICSLHHLPEMFPHSLSLRRSAPTNTSRFKLPCSTSFHAAQSSPPIASFFLITFSWLRAPLRAVPNAWDNLWLMFSKQPPPQIRPHPSVLCFSYWASFCLVPSTFPKRRLWLAWQWTAPLFLQSYITVCECATLQVPPELCMWAASLCTKLDTVIYKQMEKYCINPELHCASRVLLYLLITTDKYYHITW